MMGAGFKPPVCTAKNSVVSFCRFAKTEWSMEEVFAAGGEAAERATAVRPVDQLPPLGGGAFEGRTEQREAFVGSRGERWQLTRPADSFPVLGRRGGSFDNLTMYGAAFVPPKATQRTEIVRRAHERCLSCMLSRVWFVWESVISVIWVPRVLES